MKLHVLVVFLTGCLFGGKAAPLEVRYFTPDADVEHQRIAPAGVPHAKVRLGQVTAGAHLRYRIVHRSSEVERELYETLRWTEVPDAYVRRSLARALFADHPLDRAIDSASPTLEVEVIAFEQADRGGRQVGRVQLGYQLLRETDVIASGTVTEEHAATGPEIEAVVLAIGAAMDTATATIAQRVTSTLCPP